MAAFNAISPGEISSLLKLLGDEVLQLHRERMKRQTNVDGSPYPPLRPSTLKRKSGEGYFFTRAGKKIFVKKQVKASRNPSLRMIDTTDFQKNAFEYKVDQNGIIFGISSLPYRAMKELAREEGIATRIDKAQKKGKSTAKIKLGKSVSKNFTYTDLAKWQLSDSSPFARISKRHPNNVGCSFIGLNQNEFDKVTMKFWNSAKSLIEKNIVEYVQNAAK